MRKTISSASDSEKNFWDRTWSSEKDTKETEMIDRYITRSSVDYSYTFLGDIQNKKLLEIGCGSGYETVDFCQKGADATAIDFSTESIKAAKERCQKNGIKKVRIENMNAESLRFNDESFDCVYINKVLLHTNKDKVLQECIRVLKKNGIFVINETLKNWIFAFPYRTFSPYRKSHPTYLSLKDVETFSTEHKEFYLFSTFFLFLFYLPCNKKIALSMFNMFARVDTFLLEAFPFLRTFAWVTVACFRKKEV